MSFGSMGMASRGQTRPQNDESRPFHTLSSATPLAEPGKKRYTITFSSSFDGLDKAKIVELIEKAFGKKFVDSDAYFAAKGVIGVLREEGGNGIAIVTTLDGAPYLDKLAAIPAGNGVGAALWHELRERYPSLIWRATKENPINPWYVAKSDGHAEHGNWNVYWYGMNDNHARGMVEKVGELPKTLVKIE